MLDSTLTCSVEDLVKRPLDVLIIGSGPAGVAVAEHLFTKHPQLTVGIVERGPILTLTHVNNIFDNKTRRPFIDRFKIKPWEGAFRDGGMLIAALGGRGIVAGAHLRRFSAADFRLWENGTWPDEVIETLPAYYKDAEIVRRVSASAICGPAQTWALGTLHALQAHAPTVGVDLWSGGGFDVGRGYDSPAARLWKLLIQDALNYGDRRLFVATNAYVVKMERDRNSIEEIQCIDTSPNASKVTQSIKVNAVVVAASTIEPARLFLLSKLDYDFPLAGCYLAEHIERRAKIEAAFPIGGGQSQGVSIVVPPDTNERNDRFQIHLRGQPMSDGKLEIDIGGFAAMDPQPDNRVTLSANEDEYGIPKATTHIKLSQGDEERVDRMCRRMTEVVEMLGGEFVTERFPFEDAEPTFTDNTRTIQQMAFGRSYHEAGTLRMGTAKETSVTDAWGQVHGMTNLFVADAALFPCVGIANPMLTITALAYRVADRVAAATQPNRPRRQTAAP